MILRGFPRGEKGKNMIKYPCDGCSRQDKGNCLDKCCKSWREWFRVEWRRTIAAVKELDRKSVEGDK